MSQVRLKQLTVAPIPSAAERSAALARQAKDLANEALSETMQKIAELQAQCVAMAALETLQPGVRENLKQLAGNLVDRSQGIQSIRGRR